MLAPLNYLDNSVLRIATRAFRTTPVTSLYCLAAEPSLLLRRDFLLLSYSLKIAADVAYPPLLFSRSSQLIFTQKTSLCSPAYRRLSLLLPVFFPKPPLIFSP